MRRKAFFLCIISWFCSYYFFASDNWNLAASEFLVEDSLSITEANRSSIQTIAKILPTLILDSLPSGVNRTVYSSEIYTRSVFKLNKEQQTAYTNLTNQIKTRDSLVFKYFGTELNKQLSNSKNSIQNAEVKLKEIKAKQEALNNDYQKRGNVSVLETVQIYQNDASKLFAPKSPDDSSVSKAIQAETLSIRGLINGTIFVYDEYIKVECSLTLYPDGRVIATASEIGSLTDTQLIAKSLLTKFLPVIMNADLAKTQINILPLEAGNNAVIYCEDSVTRGNNKEISFSAGKHSIRIESPGFRNVNFTLDYQADSFLEIDVQMEKIVTLDAFFKSENSSKKQPESITDLYLNSLFVGTSPLYIKISEKAYMGEVVSADGVAEFFLLSNNYSNECLNKTGLINIKEPKKDIASMIDFSRKKMYWSYGGLICTVPIYFYCKGMYEICQKNPTVVDNATLSQWSLSKDISLYTMIGAGTNMLVQLVLYLIDSNKVIPKNIVVDYNSPVEMKSQNISVEQENTKDNPIQIPLDEVESTLEIDSSIENIKE